MARLTQFLLAAAMAGLSNAAAIQHLTAREVGVEVTLAATGNAMIEATIKNNGASGLNLFKSGSILSGAPTQNLIATSDAGVLAFEGIRVSVKNTDLVEEDFVALPAGGVLSQTINAAEVFDLSAGGAFEFAATGAIHFAKEGSLELTGAIHLESTKLKVKVDGAAAAHALAKSPVKRTAIQSSCSGTRLSNAESALRDCVSLANSASTAAKSGSASKFSEYFKTTASSSRTTVANRLSAVAKECNSFTSGATKLYCNDVYSGCSRGVLAYTLPSNNNVILCDLFFSALPVLTHTCHAQDMATTVLHEFTHAPGVYSPGTKDYAYGYSASTALSSSQAINNADSYALYSNAIYVGC